MSTVRGTGTGDGGAMTLPGFALVVSMNHTQGDGHTYYSLYGMLSAAAEIPTLSTLVRNKSALITNWATFYRDVVLHHDPEGNAPCENRPKLHFPIMEIDGIITSLWNNGIIFSPREGELAILMITRQFDSDALMQRKAQDNQNVPVGARIV